MMEEYPGYVGKDFKPFDPIELAGTTAELVCRGDARKYTDFYCAGVYGGIATGYLVGCNLRCVFCWVQLSREFPKRYGDFYTPREAANNLIRSARKIGARKARISGGEPTICKGHLLKVLDLVDQSGLFFILETNGLMLGHDPTYAQALQKYKNLYVRISVKAGTAEGFQKRTGARGDFYTLPFKAVRNALKHNLYFRVACMSDPRLMPREERAVMVEALAEAGYKEGLEEEACDPYDTTLVRLNKAGWDIYRR